MTLLAFLALLLVHTRMQQVIGFGSREGHTSSCTFVIFAAVVAAPLPHLLHLGEICAAALSHPHRRHLLLALVTGEIAWPNPVSVIPLG
jgi:hypothetical protein